MTTASVRELPQSGTALLDSAAAAAPAPVRTATDQLVATTVEPALASIAGPLADVADAVDRTTAAADAVVDPVLQAAGAEGPARSSTSPATADVPPAGRHLRAAPVDSPTTSGVASATVARPVANLAPSGNDGSRLPAIPVSPDVPAVPAGSASAGAVGMLAFVLLPTLALLRRRIRAADEPLPAGPAFGPGSSPD